MGSEIWNEIWNRVASRKTSSLIEKDGFEDAIPNIGCLNKLVFRMFSVCTKQIKSKSYLFSDSTIYLYPHYDFKRNIKILEVGAGSGMIIERLTTLFNFPRNSIYACDFSDIAIENLEKMLVPPGDILKCNANEIDVYYIHEQFDIVFAHSIFQYFDDYQYALKVVDSMYKLCKYGGTIFINDVPDVSKIDNIEDIRKSSNKDKHLYYPKEFFKYCSKILKTRYLIEYNDVNEYKYYNKRFNVILYKEN